MKLNHANLCASNVAALSDIFTRHFAFEEERAGDGFAMLRGSDGFSLVLVKMSPDSSKSYPHAGHFNFHVGFIVDTPDAVRAKHAELSESGYFPGAIKSFDAVGSIWTAFYCSVGDGIDIEVTTRSPAAGAPGSGAA